MTTDSPTQENVRTTGDPIIAAGPGPIVLGVHLEEENQELIIVVTYDGEDLADHSDTLEYLLDTGYDDVVATLPSTITYGVATYDVSATTGSTSWTTSGTTIVSPSMDVETPPSSGYSFTVTVTEETLGVRLSHDPIIKVYPRPPTL
ncbi:MAG: hypothetical protein R3A51_10610 [Nannocystaceae bacterium]|nr:hypothetical protein [Myxococcales bacterium]